MNRATTWTIAIAMLASVGAVYAQRPEPAWTPAAEAPDGALGTALAGRHHDLFIARAQKGDIQLVFFGTTETEMWLWPDRGHVVWDRALAPLKAADFGSQGSNPKQLLWRMQNGELDGYEAKLVVVQLYPWGLLPVAELYATYAPIIAQIRARQPLAKILLIAAVPRGVTPSDSRLESWRPVAETNAAEIAQLTDGNTVFFDDFGERFFLPDGSFNRDYWNGPAGAGIQPPAFEILVKALEPWIDRFVH